MQISVRTNHRTQAKRILQVKTNDELSKQHLKAVNCSRNHRSDLSDSESWLPSCAHNSALVLGTGR